MFKQKHKLIRFIKGYRGFNVKHKNAQGLKRKGVHGVVKRLSRKNEKGKGKINPP